MPDGEDEPEAPPAGLRLTFSYAEARIHLDSRQEVDMTPCLRTPLPESVEAPTGDPEAPFTRQAAARGGTDGAPALQGRPRPGRRGRVRRAAGRGRPPGDAAASALVPGRKAMTTLFARYVYGSGRQRAGPAGAGGRLAGAPGRPARRAGLSERGRLFAVPVRGAGLVGQAHAGRASGQSPVAGRRAGTVGLRQ
jgi:hypothetical protein